MQRIPRATPEPSAPSSSKTKATAETSSVVGTVAGLRSAYEQRLSRDLAWRARQLDQLLRFYVECEQEIVDALSADLGKPNFDAWVSEVKGASGHVRYLRKNLRKLLEVQKVATERAAMPARSEVIREPLGVVLVISPWNFPIELALTPLAGALAAGNCVLLKPSEVSPACSALLARRLPEYLDPRCVQVIEGGADVSTELLRARFDHIFYTGSTQIGRVVMAAAAKHLTPVTLELGGKSPCIVDETANLEVAARRIVWGKFLNCGQICVAPDYVLVHDSVREEFVRLICAAIRQFWGDDPQQSPDYGRIVNRRHHQRVLSLLDDGGRVVWGGRADESDRYIEPTVVVDVPLDAEIMQQEIFGPLMPIISVAHLDRAIEIVNDKPKPLALYVFSESAANVEQVLSHTSSGGAAVNQILFQILGSQLPFGGVGESGMGVYHGKYSIDTFSNLRSVLRRSTRFDPKAFYPPMTPRKSYWLRKLIP